MKHKFQRHLRLHVAERRFVCAVCGRAFLQAWLPDGKILQRSVAEP